MTTLETNSLPFAIITFINKNQATRQRQLDEWLATQPSSTPILRISNHQPLTSHHIKRWSLDDVITLPMSLEQQLQTTLNHLQSHHEYRTLIIEHCEILPLSTLTALKHLSQQKIQVTRFPSSSTTHSSSTGALWNHKVTRPFSKSIDSFKQSSRLTLESTNIVPYPACTMKIN